MLRACFMFSHMKESFFVLSGFFSWQKTLVKSALAHHLLMPYSVVVRSLLHVFLWFDR